MTRLKRLFPGRVRKGKPKRRLLDEAVRFSPDKGRALDLDAGKLEIARELKLAGFREVAAVVHPTRVVHTPHHGIELHVRKIEEYFLRKERYDLICCMHGLWRLGHPEIFGLFQRIHTALRPDGVFACRVLGDLDGWAADRKDSCMTPEAFKLLCSNFETIGYKRHQSPATMQVLNPSQRHRKFWDMHIALLRKRA